MNRTKEYLHIVSTFNLPQHPLNLSILCNPFSMLLNDINKIKESLNKAPHIEIRRSIKAIEILLNEEFKLPKEIQEVVHNNIIEYVRQIRRHGLINLQKVRILYQERIKREEDTRKMYITNENESNYSNNHSNVNTSNDMSSFVLEQENTTRRDVLQNQIEDQISEIGQIMAEVTLHIHAQGENLKRIDDMMVVGDNNLKNSLYNIHRTWDEIKGRRRGMINYFLVIIIIILMIYIVKKIF